MKSSPSPPKDGTPRPTRKGDVVGEASHAGHRERLRERLIAAGSSAVTDDELQELLLFMAIPRAGHQSRWQNSC